MGVEEGGRGGEGGPAGPEAFQSLISHIPCKTLFRVIITAQYQVGHLVIMGDGAAMT